MCKHCACSAGLNAHHWLLIVLLYLWNNSEALRIVKTFCLPSGHSRSGTVQTSENESVAAQTITETPLRYKMSQLSLAFVSLLYLPMSWNAYLLWLHSCILSLKKLNWWDQLSFMIHESLKNLTCPKSFKKMYSHSHSPSYLCEINDNVNIFKQLWQSFSKKYNYLFFSAF